MLLMLCEGHGSRCSRDTSVRRLTSFLFWSRVGREKAARLGVRSYLLKVESR